MKSKSKQQAKNEAIEKIRFLFQEAKNNPEKADIFVKKARNIGMKVNQPIPKEYKKKFCKHCYNYFQNGNYRVRTRNKMIVYYCFNCKKYMKLKIISQELSSKQ